MYIHTNGRLKSDLFTAPGDYENALHYHQEELALSEASVSDRLGTAIAHRRVGECLCELGDYEQAIHHQRKHLEIAQETGSLQTHCGIHIIMSVCIRV